MTDSLAVLVPVLGRPGNVGPLVESFLAGCPTDADLFFVASTDDHAERDQCEKYTMMYEHVFYTHHPTKRSWPEKINLAVSYYDDFDGWFLCAADDICFDENWWDATEQLRADPTIGVIGTNDSYDGTGNQAVAAGDHTVHPLMRASYIRDFGTWDGPGKAVCEEYHHWFCDNELVITAKLRNAWAFCRESYVIHEHPYWRGTDVVPWDDTYSLGESTAEEDKQTWFRRSAGRDLTIYPLT